MDVCLDSAFRFRSIPHWNDLLCRELWSKVEELAFFSVRPCCADAEVLFSLEMTMLDSAVSLWRRLIGTAESQTSPSVKEEDRRGWVRYPADLPTSFGPVEDDEPKHFDARIQDISLGGVKLIVPREFEPGTLLTVDLPGAEGSEPLAVLACVVHCRQHDDGDWALGCNFAQELTGCDLALFGATRVADEGARRWARFSCETPTTYHVGGSEEGEPSSGLIVNISASGLGMLVEESLEAGTLLSTHLEKQDGSSLTILACVAHIAKHADGRQYIGCSFIRELTETDLASLT